MKISGFHISAVPCIAERLHTAAVRYTASAPIGVACFWNEAGRVDVSTTGQLDEIKCLTEEAEWLKAIYAGVHTGPEVTFRAGMSPGLASGISRVAILGSSNSTWWMSCVDNGVRVEVLNDNCTLVGFVDRVSVDAVRLQMVARRFARLTGS